MPLPAFWVDIPETEPGERQEWCSVISKASRSCFLSVRSLTRWLVIVGETVRRSRDLVPLHRIVKAYKRVV